MNKTNQGLTYVRCSFHKEFTREYLLRTNSLRHWKCDSIYFGKNTLCATSIIQNEGYLHTAAGPWETGLSLWGSPPLLHIFKTVGKWPSGTMDKAHSGSTRRYLPNVYSPCYVLGAPLRDTSSQNTQSQRDKWGSSATHTRHFKPLSTHGPNLHTYTHIHMNTLTRYRAQWILRPQYHLPPKPQLLDHKMESNQ